MQARVEAVIGYVKQHSRISLIRAKYIYQMVARLPDSTQDFVLKKNFPWYSMDIHPEQLQQLTITFNPNSLALKRKYPFRQPNNVHYPREHRLVINGSFGDRFVEGNYADHTTPCIQMLDSQSKSRIKVKDFKSYPEDFPFRDQTNLVSTTNTAITQEADKMQTEDANDDTLIAEVEAVSALTRAQSIAMQAASIEILCQI
jgi:hypothetical protein